MSYSTAWTGKAVRHDLQHLVRQRRYLLDQAVEVLRRDDGQVHRRARDDRRGPRTVIEHGDLPEAVAGPERGDLPAAVQRNGFTAEHDEELPPEFPFGRQRLARLDVQFDG
jgi:hypothetical protein